jgi:site-specific DNA recombinase
LARLKATELDESDVWQVMGEFDPVWNAQTPTERCRILRLLIERVEYDGRSGEIATTFYPTGIKIRADELVA